ncbi:MAG: NADH-quinone oxidoreductase subunit J [Deltaproteobacteria bacterium]|nr:NADH-quinone oxidoreductase subunit J [Deltaproteobacteria bacterium]
MTAELLIFYFMAIMAVGGAVCVVLPPFGRNPLHAALALLVSFFFVAGIFVMLSAHLVAVLQILVYAGAVMVLFVFVVMLLNLKKDELKGARWTPWKVFGVGAGLVMFTKLALAVVVVTEGETPVNLAAEGFTGYGGIHDVGAALVTTYLLPFELTSILLLVAIIGAVLVARRQTGGAS